MDITMADSMNNAMPLVSVVLPTYNRRELTRDAIESLWRQTLSPENFEIVLVDNCSTDGMREMIAEMQQRSPVNLVYHCMPENRGVARSRNAGVRIARGEFIALIDSDCEAHPNWLEKGLAVFDQSVAFVTGPVLDKKNQHVTFFSRSNYAGLEHNATYPACNIFYRRSVYLEMGGHDENLCFGSFFNMAVECADTDLAWRIKEHGYNNVFVPDLFVYHEVEKLEFRRWLTHPFRLFAVPAIVQRHPQLRPMLLSHGVFFLKESPANYLAVAALLLSVTWHPAAAVLTLPYIICMARFLNWELSLLRLPKLLVQLVLVTLQQTVACAGLIYGSAKFRSLVL
jgi:glycosyltransferase involved in cell wall biosynthesis